eukprot:2368486-Rhodomonas_salina.1
MPEAEREEGGAVVTREGRGEEKRGRKRLRSYTEQEGVDGDAEEEGIEGDGLEEDEDGDGDEDGDVDRSGRQREELPCGVHRRGWRYEARWNVLQHVLPTLPEGTKRWQNFGYFSSCSEAVAARRTKIAELVGRAKTEEILRSEERQRRQVAGKWGRSKRVRGEGGPNRWHADAEGVCGEQGGGGKEGRANTETIGRK